MSEGNVTPSTDLERLSQAERMLAEIATAADAVQVMDYAEAARVFAQKAGLGVGCENHATVIKVCAEIRLAEVVKAGQDAGVIAKRGSAKGNQHTGKVAPDDVTTLDSLKVSKQRLSQARKMSKKYTPAKIRALADECTAAEQPISRKQLLNGEAVQQSKTNEWYTPVAYLDAARKVLGGIDLDPASCAEANESVQADRFLTKDDDGLRVDWVGRVWLNPPYGRLAGDFVTRLVDLHSAGSVTAAVTLVNAHCTDTKWFQSLWDHTLCFTDHRIDFANGTDDRGGSTHGSVFVYLGPDPGLFATEFASFGAIVRRWP